MFKPKENLSISDLIKISKDLKEEKSIFEKQIFEDGITMSHEQIKRFYNIYNMTKTIEYYESRKLPPLQYGVMI